MRHSPVNLSASRRDFIKAVGATIVGAGLAGCGGVDGSQLTREPPLTHLSATKLARLIADGHASAVKVAEAYLARIAEVNPKINAIFHVDPDRILAEARQADRDLKHGNHRGPLHGVPFSMKDQLQTKGIMTTNGCPELKN